MARAFMTILAALAAIVVLVPSASSVVPVGSPVTPKCPGGDITAAALSSATRFTDEPRAGDWRSWSVNATDVPVLPAPQVGSATTARELAELHIQQAIRTGDQVAFAQAWGTGPATKPWEETNLKLLQTYTKLDGKLSPPRVARELALLETSMYDALVATWHAKACYQRPGPSTMDPTLSPVVPLSASPSYPSEHAAVAGAAAVIMDAFFPHPVNEYDSLALAAANSRIVAGANYRSDVDAGYAIGRFVAQQVLAARAGDGSAAVWSGSVPTGTCNWKPTPPNNPAPIDPLWGNVQPFLMTSGSMFRPPPPPACDGAQYTAEMQDVYQQSLHLTQRQKDIAAYWAGAPGTETPPGMNVHIAMNESVRHGLGTMRHARVVSYVAVAEADAGIAAWDTKYTYWADRPVLGIQRTIDPTWLPSWTTPGFPGYISGHATFSSAAAQTLSSFFPDDAIALRAMATEAADSRFYGGIHVHSDNELGLATGAKVGDLAAGRAAVDGAGN